MCVCVHACMTVCVCVCVCVCVTVCGTNKNSKYYVYNMAKKLGLVGHFPSMLRNALIA